MDFGRYLSCGQKHGGIKEIYSGMRELTGE